MYTWSLHLVPDLEPLCPNEATFGGLLGSLRVALVTRNSICSFCLKDSQDQVKKLINMKRVI